MSKKKRFGLSHNLNQGMTEAINAAENNGGSVRYEVIALSRIETDPANPRDLVITLSDIKNGISLTDGSAKEKQKEIENLHSLAETIKKNGLINPIVVYKCGEKYRLVAGERRFLASMIAKKEDIQARILSEKPNNVDLRILQWIENTEREDLSLKDRINNVKVIIQEYKKANPAISVTATHLKDLISISLPQATAYIAVLNAPEDVQSEIEVGKINNIDKAAYIAKINSVTTRKKALEACISGSNLKQMRAIVESEITVSQLPMKTLTSKRGRVTTRVNLGVTKRPEIVKKIIHSIVKQSEYSSYHAKFENIDWMNFEQVAKAFRMLLGILEKESR